VASPHAALVSVIIPTHNRSALLMEAVDSILAQTYPVHEIVIVDDGSDEPHRSAVEALARRSPLIRAHLLPPGERSRARNEALARATGEYVIFLDDDDRLENGTIEAALRSFGTGAPVDVVVVQARQFGDIDPLHARPLNPFWIDSAAEPEGRTSVWMGVSAATRLDLEHHPKRVLLWCFPPINAFVIRRDAIGATRFSEDLHFGEDLLFWFDLAAKGCRFRVSGDGTAFVRRHPGNTSRWASTVEARKRLLERVEPLGREETFLASALLARACWTEGHAERWRAAAKLTRYPDLLLRYGRQFLVRRAFRFWLRASAGLSAATASVATPTTPLQSREPDRR
jgi:Glycosyl transferase family 2